ncbi:MAG: Na+/H+ antiporter NhaC family protein [Clostridiales bacterium]|nr:Na+/H+ antiporter NhaC family protein [Clostridiales bacterium]
MNFFKAFLKFVPVGIMAFLMFKGVDALTAAPVATFAAIAVAFITERIKFQECIDAAMESVSKILIALFILMFAYAMASAFMTTGVGASVVLIALNAGITGKTIACLGIIVTAVLSIATGTSWGTFAACAPIFLWLNHLVDGNLLLTTAAIAGGACFGDNIGLISDTTVVSSGIQGVEIIKRIRHQGVWSILCLAAAIIAFFVVGNIMVASDKTTTGAEAIAQIKPEVFEYLMEKKPAAVDLLHQVESGVPYYMIIPLILVIVLAVLGMSTFVCLGAGIVSAYVLGIFAGTVDSFGSYVNLIQAGFADAGSWVVVMMMWVAAFGGIMARMDAFAPLSAFIVTISGKVRHLMTCNAILSLLGNALLADEMAQIVTVGPIIKNLLEENVEASEEDMYTLKLRNATFGDAFGVFGSQLIPWHVYLAFYVGIATNVYPLHNFQPKEFIYYNFMAQIAVVSLIVLTFTGLDRFIPLFKLPTEPAVRLKKHAKAA